MKIFRSFFSLIFLFLIVLLSSSFIAAEGEVCAASGSGCSVEDASKLPSSFTDEPITIDDLNIAEAHNDEQICVVYFYSEACAHCKNVKPFLEEIESKYGDQIHFNRLNVKSFDNFQLYNKFCGSNGYSGKEIPLIAIGNKFFVGEKEIRDNLEVEIEVLLESTTSELICPLTKSEQCYSNLNGTEKVVGQITLGAIFIAGIIDGINPCAFAVLLFLMTILFELSGSKKRILRIGISYITSFFLTNLAMGLLVYWFSDLVFGGSTLPLKFAAGVAMFAALINIKDFFWYGKGFSLKIPDGAKKIYKPLIMRASVPACVILGFLIAIFEAPCSASIYYAVIEMLRTKTTTLISAIPYLLIYNLMFILPLVILFAIVYEGKNLHVMENWRRHNRKWMKLAMGAILLLFSIAVFMNLI